MSQRGANVSTAHLHVFRADVFLRFSCTLSSGQQVWLTADQVLDRGGHAKLLQYAHDLRTNGELPAPGTVSIYTAGYPCQELSIANRKARSEGLFDSGQVCPEAAHLV